MDDCYAACHTRYLPGTRLTRCLDRCANTADSATVVLAFMTGFIAGGIVVSLIASRFM